MIGVNDPDTFHRLLCNGLNPTKEIPKEWNWNTITKYASFLDDSEAETFDPSFFNLTIGIRVYRIYTEFIFYVDLTK